MYVLPRWAHPCREPDPPRGGHTPPDQAHHAPASTVPPTLAGAFSRPVYAPSRQATSRMRAPRPSPGTDRSTWRVKLEPGNLLCRVCRNRSATAAAVPSSAFSYEALAAIRTNVPKTMSSTGWVSMSIRMSGRWSPTGQGCTGRQLTAAPPEVWSPACRTGCSRSGCSRSGARPTAA